MGRFSTPSNALAHVTIHRHQATECPFQDQRVYSCSITLLGRCHSGAIVWLGGA